MRNRLLALLLLILPAFASAQTLSVNDPEVAQLLALVELTEIDGRTMAKVPMSLILQLALERSQTLKASRQSQDAAQQGLVVAKLRNPWTITSSASFSRSAALTSSYLTGKKNNTITLGSGLSKRTDSGVSYGLDYSETRSQSADLERTNLSATTAFDADFSEAILSGMQWEPTVFSGGDFSNADFSRASMDFVDMVAL